MDDGPNNQIIIIIVMAKLMPPPSEATDHPNKPTKLASTHNHHSLVCPLYNI